MSIRVFDGHCDTAFALWQKEEALATNTCHIDLDKAAAFAGYAQVFAFCSNVGRSCTQEEAFLLPLVRFQKELAHNAQRIVLAKNAQAVQDALAQGKIAAMLSLEGPEAIGCDAEKLPWLREQGFVMTTLTWNFDNALAGCHTSAQRGLSERGRAFVKQAQELKILIDVSHLSRQAFWDLCDITQGPILASHSNCRALRENTRNLTDDQLRAIAGTGGTVGLTLYPPFLSDEADFSVLHRHLEHMLHLCGETHVALGGDFDGCPLLATGFSSVAGYLEFYEYLRQCGYDIALLEKIFYSNLFALMRSA